MLFNSTTFLFLFLPLVVLAYHCLLRLGRAGAAKAWLVIASLYFYAYWKLEYLPLLLLSIVVNYYLGIALAKTREGRGHAGALLGLGLFFNLGVLAYFKYAGFLLELFNALGGSDFSMAALVLPLAISFFTFQQIAYLVDCYKGFAHEYGFVNYCVFVTFFPQLIAGPIVHHKQMMPQFAAVAAGGNSVAGSALAAQGLFIFALGLFKKVCVADSFAPLADAGFSQAVLSRSDAWLTSLSYTFQLYYDFSGYSDMAIGAALLFGIRLPVNFLSPYRASSIREFWRMWHITLSTWLRDYVFIPLGGSQSGTRKTLRNLLLTFLVGGIWHGAGWTFIVWGGMHGLAMVVQRLWSTFARPMPRWLGWLLTFNFINITWVFFRAPDLATAQRIIGAMFSPADSGLSGVLLYQAMQQADNPLYSIVVGGLNLSLLWLAPLVLLATVFARNSMEQSGYDAGAIALPNWKIVIAACAFALAVLFLLAGSPSVFLYFNF
ncbi:MBOAT family O-acyltransferase [Haliea sp. E17]|uniref:MBOAT family O-acyltransferase n=1 Tax=Haliea sp. E17 TaxID=3401576 RepID=UPI003AB09039